VAKPVRNVRSVRKHDENGENGENGDTGKTGENHEKGGKMDYRMMTWKRPKWGQVDAALVGGPCGGCDGEVTTICTARSADNECELVMYLCDLCRDKFMAFIGSGGVGLWTT